MNSCHHAIWACFHDGQVTYRSGWAWVTIPEWAFWLSIVAGFIVLGLAGWRLRTRGRY